MTFFGQLEAAEALTSFKPVRLYPGVSSSLVVGVPLSEFVSALTGVIVTPIRRAAALESLGPTLIALVDFGAGLALKGCTSGRVATSGVGGVSTAGIVELVADSGEKTRSGAEGERRMELSSSDREVMAIASPSSDMAKGVMASHNAYRQAKRMGGGYHEWKVWRSSTR